MASNVPNAVGNGCAALDRIGLVSSTTSIASSNRNTASRLAAISASFKPSPHLNRSNVRRHSTSARAEATPCVIDRHSLRALACPRTMRKIVEESRYAITARLDVLPIEARQYHDGV